MKLHNLTALPQPVLAQDGTAHTIPAGGAAELPDADAQLLAREQPERFSLQAPTKPAVKKSKKEN